MALKTAALGVSAAMLFGGALAAPEAAPEAGRTASADPAVQAPAANNGEGETGEEASPPDPDNSADQLNAQQELEQTFTLQRKINGEIVETDRRTVTYERGAPLRQTEAARSVLQALKASFDKELLTRNEAFEEAKLDFSLADADRDGMMTADEFERLIRLLTEKEAMSNDPAATDPATSSPTPISDRAAFVAALDATPVAQASQARAKFSFMAGAAQTLDRQTFIQEYLRDFDAMDTDEDGMLRGEELAAFRAAIRGAGAPAAPADTPQNDD